MKKIVTGLSCSKRVTGNRSGQQAGGTGGLQVQQEQRHQVVGDQRERAGGRWGSQKLPEVSSPDSVGGEEMMEGALSQTLSPGSGVHEATLLELEAQLQVVYQWLAIAMNPSEAAQHNPHGDPDALRQSALANAGTGLLETLMGLPLGDRQVWELFVERFGAAPSDLLDSAPDQESDDAGDMPEAGWESVGSPSEAGRSQGSRGPSPCPVVGGGEYEDLSQYNVPCDTLPRFSSIAGGHVPKRILKECVIYPSKFPHLFQAPPPSAAPSSTPSGPPFAPAEAPQCSSDLSPPVSSAPTAMSWHFLAPYMHPGADAPPSPQGVRQPWKGILLYGPPGTGKTELAKGIAGESGAAFLLLTPSALLSKFMGESEKMMSRIFAYAKHLGALHGAAIIFLDEVGVSDASRKKMNQQPLSGLSEQSLSY